MKHAYLEVYLVVLGHPERAIERPLVCNVLALSLDGICRTLMYDKTKSQQPCSDALLNLFTFRPD
jgi:hypothetical protein